MFADASANPLSVIKWGNYRISILTSRCIRIEYNSKLIFEDRPSRTFSRRNHPMPQFTKEMSLENLQIFTNHLKITFTDPRAPPNETNTTIMSHLSYSHTENEYGANAQFYDFEWKYFLPSTAKNSIIDIKGYSVIDDHHTPILNKDGIYVLRTKCETDTYFFGYGNSYKDGLSDYFLISGVPELLPEYAFRMSFTSKSIENALKVCSSFETRKIFFGSVFFGENWHSPTRLFHWNSEIYDNIASLKKYNLKIGVLIDFLKGVSSREDQYKDVAAFLKLEQRQTAEYGLKKSSYISAFVKFILTPLEKDGADFFCVNEEVFPLSRSFFNRKTNNRSLMFTKYNDLACHRFPCPLSSKKIKTWEDLVTLPNYISNLVNRGIIYELFEINEIKHDDELCVRVFQFASLLPLVRMSTSVNFPWNLNSSIACFLLAAISLHNELSPFYYSISYKCFNELKSIIHPMYYYFSDDQSSFYCPCQFMIGENVIAAPFITKIDEETHFAWNAVWMPTLFETNDNLNGKPVVWFDFETGREYSGGWHGIHGTLSSTPLFVRSGSVIPTRKDGQIFLHVFPRGSQTFTLYEDDGESKMYKKGKFMKLKIETKWESDYQMMLTFERIGDYSFFTQNQDILNNMIIRLRNFNKRAKVTGDTNVTISHSRIEFEDITFNVKIEKFPAIIRIRCHKEEKLCVDKTQMTSADLTAVLKAANVATWVKQSDMDCLPKGTFFPRLTASSHVLHERVRLLLLEELEDCGFIHFSKEMGKDVFVVWNNSDSDLFTYMYKRFEPLKKEEITESSGPVPLALFFSPEKEITIRHRHLVDLPTAQTLLELRICDTLMFSIDFDSMK
ncbi:hypothetical protein TRFO_19632 [Tritrichomonas foetus]|uniref:Uncharacterized protein n=1 Tax=Tritrichomonas foetus TaxID=1144522 RepID=A0A1J4KJ23_9EUKA|nr:hypothetical protein TRFO_19632 [Tritrichomonas foetus]|eukprot:OHT10936.1 hypothetical protein TRFO_19632 [Tritrichomonas foetus]